MTILPLDTNTAKLITTTQIITSVSSATKELIENALDADGKNIEINLTDNGCTLIEVKDDGCGISKVDASYMALSSYTSKIVTFSDLDSLETYGFRGEALHALSVVSDLRIISKTEQDEVAVSYDIDRYGHIKKTEPCHRATGTTVQVKQLFKHLPVRRQIITNSKRANQDIKTLESLVKSYGMCKFDVRISYKVDSIIKFAKPSTATLEEAVTYVLGRKVTSNMSWINIENTETNGKLMIPSKELQNVSEAFQSGAQYIFVNNRPIKHKELEKMLTKTISTALEQDSSSRKKPIFLLYIFTNSGNIDVNLEPNKTSIFFKEESIILNTIQTCLENFYGIQKQVQEENVCNQSLNEYQDCTQNVIVPNVENEWPPSKKRKLLTEENVTDNNEKVVPKKCTEIVSNLKCTITDHSKDNEQAAVSERDKNYDMEHLDLQMPSLNLSDSDSNESQNFTLRCNEHGSPELAAKTKKGETDDSPPIELSQNHETLSQLPTVDLGEDFNWDDCSHMNTTEKENKKQSANVKSVHEENKLRTKKCVTLKEWSKGHVSNLKGGTDVQPYNYSESNESSDNDTHHKNVCAGFLKFMKHIRPQVAKQNDNLTAAQIANTVTNLWKRLSSEERGYYRDLAREEESEREKEKQETKRKHVTDVNKNKNRLLKALEKMKTVNPENNKNLVMRTIVPWDVNLTKVTGNFLDNNTCKNTNVIVGLLRSNLWIVHKSSHIWILDATTLKKELNIADRNASEDTAENMEQLLKQWFSIKDDLSLLHPIHSLPQNNDTS